MIELYDPFGRAMSLRQLMDDLLSDAFVLPRVGLGQPVDDRPRIRGPSTASAPSPCTAG